MKNYSSGRERRLLQGRIMRSNSHVLPYWQYRRSTADMKELTETAGLIKRGYKV
ncbi:MAG: hypothetical protein DDT22_01093 [candidate division WS2 bacterium]|nr:hypothetical protein [Candidatus Lithacetigena glycinireducens]